MIFRRRWLATVLVASVLMCLPASAEDKSAVSPSKLKLPKGPGSLEGIGENAEPNLSMGLLTYGVPIVLPDGYHGMKPDLRLSYSSGSGQSVVGFGWSIGSPTIERMTNKLLPQYCREGAAPDRFAANGGEELVRVAENGNEATYRARFEGGFVRYTWIDFQDCGEGYWKAEYPDGKVGYFGADKDGVIIESARVRGPEGTFRYHLVEMVDVFDHSIVYDYEKDGSVSLMRRASWVFRDDGSPRYQVLLDYETRQDEQSDGKPGFDVRLTKRLRDITVLSRNAQLRRYRLIYEPYDISGGQTRLRRVRHFGTDNNSWYPIEFSFTYSNTPQAGCTGGSCFDPVFVEMDGFGAQGLVQGEADFIDLNGDALPDVLHVQEGGLLRPRYNVLDADGNHYWETQPLMEGNAAPLANAGVQMFDFNGDGFADLLDSVTGQLFRSDGSGDWAGGPEPVQAADIGLPDLSAGSSYRFFDYNNDKAIDLIYADGSDTFFLVNRGDGTFETSATYADDGGGLWTTVLPAGFNTGLQMADMNGDGMQDAVIQQGNGALSYYLNLGWGRWSREAIEMVGEPGQQGAPRLVDVDGDALSDALYVLPGEVLFARNQNGRGFAAAVSVVDDALPLSLDGVEVRLSDMNANGSVDVAYVAADGAVSFLDLYPEKPNLLTRIENGIGKAVVLAYSASSAPDAAYPLPMSTVSLDSMEVLVDGAVDVRRTTFSYQQPGWDAERHEFAGFRSVDTEILASSSRPGLREEHVFALGVGDRELRGSLLRQRRVETASDGAARELDAQHQDFISCPADAPDIFFACLDSRITTVVEGGDSEVTTRTSYEYDQFGNVVLEFEEGIVQRDGAGCRPCETQPTPGHPCGEQCLGDERRTEKSYASPATGGAWQTKLMVEERKGRSDGFEQMLSLRYFYDGLSFASFDRGRLTHVERLADNDSWTVDRTNTEDNHGRLVEERDAQGYGRYYRYESDGMGLLEERLDISLEPQRQLAQTAQLHPVLDAVVETTDWQNTQPGEQPPLVLSSAATRYSYDSFGRLVTVQRPEDDAATPSESYEYDLRSPYSAILAHSRTEANGPQDALTVSCFDGEGRRVEKRTRTTGNQFLIEEWVQLAATGEPLWSSEPFDAVNSECRSGSSSPPGGAMQVFYDGANREVARSLPDADIHETRSLIEKAYRPYEIIVKSADRSATKASERRFSLNGLGQVIRVTQEATSGLTLSWDLFPASTGANLGYSTPDGVIRRQFLSRRGDTIRVEDSESGVTTYSRDLLGRVTTALYADGSSVEREYDGVGRISREIGVSSDGDSMTTEIYYDTQANCLLGVCGRTPGRVASIVYDDDVIESRQYDIRGREIGVTRRFQSGAYTLEREFNNVDDVVGETFAGGAKLERRYDLAGRLVVVPGVLSAVVYDGAELRRIERANGATDEFTHSASGQLTSFVASTGAGEDLLRETLGYDREGQVLSRETQGPGDVPGTQVSHEVDPFGRTVSVAFGDVGGTVTAVDVEYESGRSRIATRTSSDPRLDIGAFEYDPSSPSRPAEMGGEALEYDAAGRLVTTASGLSLEYDASGRLRGAHLGAESKLVVQWGRGLDKLRVEDENGDALFVDDAHFVQNGMPLTQVLVGARLVAQVASGPVLDPGSTLASLATQNSASLSELEAQRLLLLVAQRRLVGAWSVDHFHFSQMGFAEVSTDETGAVTRTENGFPAGLMRAQRGQSWPFVGYLASNGFLEGHALLGPRLLDSRSATWCAPDPLYAILSVEPDAESVEDAFPDLFGGYAYAGGRVSSYVDPSGLKSLFSKFVDKVSRSTKALGATLDGVSDSLGKFVETKLNENSDNKRIGKAAGKFVSGVTKAAGGALMTAAGLGVTAVGVAGAPETFLASLVLVVPGLKLTSEGASRIRKGGGDALAAVPELLDAIFEPVQQDLDSQ